MTLDNKTAINKEVNNAVSVTGNWCLGAGVKQNPKVAISTDITSDVARM